MRYEYETVVKCVCAADAYTANHVEYFYAPKEKK